MFDKPNHLEAQAEFQATKHQKTWRTNTDFNPIVMYADKQILNDIDRLKELKRELDRRNNEYDSICESIKIRMGDCTDLQDDEGEVLATYRPNKTETVRLDTKTIQKKNPILWESLIEDYGVTSVQRPFKPMLKK